MAVNFKTTPINAGFNGSTYPSTLVEFTVEGGNMAPSDLKDLNIPDVDGSKGVVISGRGPVWLYAHLAHHYHVTVWVGTFDPRVIEGGGAVVVSTHARNVPPIGSVVTVPKSE